jgi:hypothetical protein
MDADDKTDAENKQSDLIKFDTGAWSKLIKVTQYQL